MRKPRGLNFSRRVALLARALVCLCLSALAALAMQSCERKTAPKHNAQGDDSYAPRDLLEDARPTPTPPRTRRITAAWYPVPPQSLAKRRAPDELTAAHNSLPLGTRVQVTNPDNGRTVIVRITDRGIRDRRVKLDVCKEAAEELGMVSDGLADLKMEVLSAEGEASSFASQSSAPVTDDQSRKSE